MSERLQLTKFKTGPNRPPITSYEQFHRDAVEDNIAVDVHMQEQPDAIGNILMVHGAGGGSWAWEAYFGLLGDSYNLYALSWRGHFTSTPVDDANSADYVRDQAAVLAAIAERNDLPIHVIGHSYGGATSVLLEAQSGGDIASLHLLAPVVPLDYSPIQQVMVPAILPRIIRASLQSDNPSGRSFQGMFLVEAQMERYLEAYASQPFSVEKPGLLADDAFDVGWQNTLGEAYQTVGESDLPVWFIVARYDNVVVTRRQQDTAEAMDAPLIELESGHYIQLDNKARESAEIILTNLEGDAIGFNLLTGAYPTRPVWNPSFVIRYL
jgi:pimeloyl-ACP methyl ester carboxylesterase